MKKSRRPLYLDDGKCVVPNLPIRMDAISKFQNAVADGTLKLIKNKCLCHNDCSYNDVVISEKDRYGLSVPQIICSKCGLIRSGLVLDYKSNRTFYEKYYRKIYLASENKPLDALWADEYSRGEKVLRLIHTHIILDSNSRIAEVGCGAGGCLEPFREEGMQVSGYDFDEEYLDYGRNRGLDLYYGNIHELVDDNSVDLLLMNHVFEHFLDPIQEMKKLLPKVKTGKFLYIEVPGIFNIHNVYHHPICYFQNAHVYNFYKDYLVSLFESFKLRIVYGDEKCCFIIQKTNTIPSDINFIYNTRLSDYPDKIYKYLFRVNRYRSIYVILSMVKGFSRRIRVKWKI